MSNRFYRALLLVCCTLFTLQCVSVTTPSNTKESQAPVAEIDGKAISLHELDEWAKDALFNAKVQELNQYELYDLRREYLEELLTERMLQGAASQADVSTKEYVLGKDGTAISENEIVDFYQKNAEALGGTLDQWHDKIREHLEVEKYDQRKAELVEQLKAKHQIRILLEAPRITVAARGATRGPDNAPVTIVEFSDYQCRFCLSVHPTLKKILENYPDQVRLVYRHFAIPGHTRAKPAAHAAECAGAQGKFWEYHDAIFENTSALADADLEKFAKAAKLDVPEYRRCMKENRFAKKIEQDFADAEASGVQGTPTFVINGRILTGAKPYKTFEKIIEEELARKHE